jgi:RimJ/RimL family protein N-acetyltransferase
VTPRRPAAVPVAWPLFALRVRTPRLTLRLAGEAELLALAERAAGRVLAPDQRGFMGSWTQLTSPQFERSFMQHHWRTRASWQPEHWELDLGVFPTGEPEPVGMIGAGAQRFASQRSATTGSWLLPEARGRGLGIEARAAILQLLFGGLGAREARSGAHPDNAPSHAVSRRLGYRQDGTEPFPAADSAEPVTMIRLLLTREDWLAAGRRPDIVIEGLEACLDMFGLDARPAEPA